jgi:hypothetical protein
MAFLSTISTEEDEKDEAGGVEHDNEDSEPNVTVVKTENPIESTNSQLYERAASKPEPVKKIGVPPLVGPAVGRMEFTEARE